MIKVEARFLISAVVGARTGQFSNLNRNIYELIWVVGLVRRVISSPSIFVLSG